MTSRSPRALTLVLVLVVGVVSCLIVGASLSQVDPYHAPFIDNQPHTLEANADTWFKFDYGLVNSTPPIVMLRLVNGASSGVRFEVWAPKDIAAWSQNQPVGRGTVARVDCSTGLPGGTDCLSNDLSWAGAFGGPGTFYVHVVNDTPSPQSFFLTIQGAGVGLGAPTAPGATTPGATAAHAPTAPPPTHTSTPSAAPAIRDDPNFAAPIDGQLHSIPAQSATWYKFDYGSGRNVVSLRLVNGVQTLVRFEVWAGKDIPNWWGNKPVGRGTQEVIVGCNPAEATETVEADTPTPTAEPPSGGHCPTNDLTWSGAFGGAGTYYVRVVNDNIFPMDYVLTIQ